jgi:hypothetical protein
MPMNRVLPIPPSYIDRAVRTSREPGNVIWIALTIGHTGPLPPAHWIVKDTTRGRDAIESRGIGAPTLVATPPR